MSDIQSTRHIKCSKKPHICNHCYEVIQKNISLGIIGNKKRLLVRRELKNVEQKRKELRGKND